MSTYQVAAGVVGTFAAALTLLVVALVILRAHADEHRR